jgi:hypothetical protein
MPLHHHESFALQAVHLRSGSATLPARSCAQRPTQVSRLLPYRASGCQAAQRRRFIMSAMQPASRPPPAIVVANVNHVLALPAGCVSYRRSRTPPSTISTDKVVSDPMPNHQMNLLTLPRPSPKRAVRLTQRDGTACGQSSPPVWTCQGRGENRLESRGSKDCHRG